MSTAVIIGYINIELMLQRRVNLKGSRAIMEKSKKDLKMMS